MEQEHKPIPHPKTKADLIATHHMNKATEQIAEGNIPLARHHSTHAGKVLDKQHQQGRTMRLPAEEK